MERWNQTLKSMLVKFVEDKREEWDTVLDCCVFTYNTSKNASSLYSPFEIMYGRKAVLPIEFSTDEDRAVLEELSEKLPDVHVSICVYTACLAN